MRHTIFAALLSLSLSACGQDTAPLSSPDSSNDIRSALTSHTATFSDTYQTPFCSTGGATCDSGALLNGRSDSFPEANRPNTLHAACADGTWSGYFSKRAIEHLSVSTTDGAPLAAGKTVKLQATVYAYSLVQDKLDLYYSSNVDSPSWTFLGTYSPTQSGLNTFSVTYTLPAGAIQAVRANFRFVDASSPNSPASLCSTGNYDDHDDLLFSVRSAIH